MRFALVSLALLAACHGATTENPSAPSSTEAPRSTFYSFVEKSIDGKPVRLSEYAGKVVLVVNVASRCGFTSQYAGLEALYRKHKDAGLVILGFPCDQFGNQEPGTEQEIKTFCNLNYDVTFPLFAKSEVNGPNANPLYVYLRKEQPGALTKDMPGADKLYEHLEKNLPEVLGTDAVKWNFTKFLLDRQGNVVRRFESPETPESIEKNVVELLAKR